jgi:hypothetical protein
MGAALADTVHTRGKRGLLVGGAISLWVLGLLWALADKTDVATSAPDTERDLGPYDASESPNVVVRRPKAEGEEPVSEITVEAGPSSKQGSTRSADFPGLAEAETDTETDTGELVEEPALPTYSVWFESERELGVCKITYEGGSKTANLHVAARLPEGRLDFSYRCGKQSGRASIDVKPNRINGVLFCEDSGDVSVETVRKKDGRCDR